MFCQTSIWRCARCENSEGIYERCVLVFYDLCRARDTSLYKLCLTVCVCVCIIPILIDVQ